MLALLALDEKLFETGETPDETPVFRSIKL